MGWGWVNTYIYVIECVCVCVCVFNHSSPLKSLEGRLHGVMAKELDCGLEVSEFELQLLNYINLYTNFLGKSIKFPTSNNELNDFRLK